MKSTLSREIELNRDFVSLDEELLLALIYSNQLLDQASVGFLKQFELTPTQFNALMIVRDYERDGINQVELSRRLLINQASTGTLIDNLGKRELLARRKVEGDRRAYHLCLTPGSRRLLKKILVPYYQLIEKTFAGFTKTSKRGALEFLATFRGRLRRALHDLEPGA